MTLPSADDCVCTSRECHCGASKVPPTRRRDLYALGAKRFTKIYMSARPVLDSQWRKWAAWVGQKLLEFAYSKTDTTVSVTTLYDIDDRTWHDRIREGEPSREQDRIDVKDSPLAFTDDCYCGGPSSHCRCGGRTPTPTTQPRKVEP